jgi:hypothetical protein
VQAVDGGNNPSPYSAVWSFTISFGGTEEIPTKKPVLSFGIKSNPSAGRALFSLNMPEAGEATLRIYDATGRLIDTPLSGKLSAGAHALAWTPDAAGIYFCVMEVGEARLSRKFIIVN